MAETKSSARYLLTGGMGFIGSHLWPLLAHEPGADLWLFDSLSEQVHGPKPALPKLPANVRFTRGDVRERAALEAVVREARPTVAIHLAAETGTGQSLDLVTRYCEVNVMGTAHLLESLRAHAPALARLVLPS